MAIRHSLIVTLLLSTFTLAISGNTFANANNLTQVGQYRVELSDPNDTLSCRESATVKAEKLTEYPNGHTIKVIEITVQDNKPWFKTPDNCYVRAHTAYLTPVDENINPPTVTPIEAKAPSDFAATNEQSNEQTTASNPSHPVMVALAQLPPFEGKSQQISMNFETAESPNKALVMITEDGYLDDSVAGSRYTFQLVLDEEGNWKVIGKTHLLKCQQGRGHQDYSKEPCL